MGNLLAARLRGCVASAGGSLFRALSLTDATVCCSCGLENDTMTLLLRCEHSVDCCLIPLKCRRCFADFNQ